MPHTTHQPRLPSKRLMAGLTLLHILLLVAALGLLASWGLSKWQASSQAAHPPEVATALKDMTEIMQGLTKYQQANGQYPTTEQGLLALIIKPQQAPIPANWETGGYVKRLPRDPWGNSYQYRLRDDQQVELFSYGDPSTAQANDDTRINVSI